MSDVLVSVFARTDVGLHRAGNEDAFLVADLTTGKTGLGPEMSTHPVGDRGSLMVVSDGMGGAVAGEIASELAVKTVRESLLDLPLDMDISERLRISTEIANEAIWKHAQSHPHLSGMGATLTAVLVHRDTAYIAQVGDSRAYLIRGNQIKQLTKDQSLVQMLVDSGAIQPEQASSVPQNVIMQALGTQPTVKVAMSAVELCRNDYLIVCSDGLSNKIQSPEMHRIVEESGDLTAACRRLVEIANERGGEDNITVIVARFDGVGLHSASDSNTITGSFRNLNAGYFTDSQYQPQQPQQQSPQSDITTMVMKAIPAPGNMQQPIGASAPTEAEETQPTSKLEEVLARPAPVVVRPGQRQPEKKGYLTIIVVVLFSLILLGAAGWFIYAKFLRPVPETPSDVEEPAAVSQ